VKIEVKWTENENGGVMSSGLKSKVKWKLISSNHTIAKLMNQKERALKKKKKILL